jgi:DNA-directed RNA polymerase subunit alpha
MSTYNIILPSKPRIVKEEDRKGVYEIDNLHPGYGYTLGNSLRRIILSSLPGAAITKLKIDNASHEFSTLDGVKEDVMNILLNLKRVRFAVSSDEAQVVSISVKGAKTVTAADIKVSGQVEVLNPEQYIAELTDKNATLEIELTIERGLGFVPKEAHQKGKMDIGTIAVDAIFSPIRRVAYEVENMRVGDKTNHNRLRMIIETDGTISPREALEQSITIMIEQLKAMVDIPSNDSIELPSVSAAHVSVEDTVTTDEKKEDMTDIMKTRIDTLELSTRTLNALTDAGIRTVGGIARKKKEDLLEIEGIGEKGIQEIRRALSNFGITLK